MCNGFFLIRLPNYYPLKICSIAFLLTIALKITLKTVIYLMMVRLTLEDIPVPLCELPDPESDAGNPSETLRQQENKWTGK